MSNYITKTTIEFEVNGLRVKHELEYVYYRSKCYLL